jgi:DHA1 family bicyclomycin/chloramphenicol resistance-like MFS transporter
MELSIFKRIILLSLISTACVSASIITPALPEIQLIFNLSEVSLTLMVSVFLFGYMTGQLIYAPIANRFGRLAALRGGLCINIIGLFVCLTALYYNKYNILLLGRLITALGAAAGLSCTFMLINELFSPENAKKILSFITVSFSIGIGTSIYIGGILTQYFNWRYSFVVLILHGLLMLSFTWQFKETMITPIKCNFKNLMQGYLVALKSKKLITYAIMLGFAATIVYTYATAGPIIAHEYLLFSPSQYVKWNLITMSGMLIGGPLTVYLYRYMKVRQVLLIGLIGIMFSIISFFIILKYIITSPIIFFLSGMSLYLFASMLFPTTSFYASNAITDKASASSMMSFINLSTTCFSIYMLGILPFPIFYSYIIVLSTFLIVCSILFYISRKYK